MWLFPFLLCGHKLISCMTLESRLRYWSHCWASHAASGKQGESQYSIYFYIMFRKVASLEDESAHMSAVNISPVPNIRAETICPDHDMIRYAIWCTRYDMFRNTFAILSWEAEACDPGLQSEAPPSTFYNCLCSNDAQWLQQWRPPQSFQMQCVCDEFPCVIGIYWLLSAVSHVRF